VTELLIHPRLKDAIVAPRASEVALLEESIIAANAIYDSIKAWKDPATSKSYILDGHHRYEIGVRNMIPYSVEFIELPNESEAIMWAYKWQASRRNLNDESFHYYIGKMYNKTREADATKVPATEIDETSAAKVGESFGVSRRTVFRDASYAEAIDSIAKPVRDSLLNGELPASRKDILELAKQPVSKQMEVAKSVMSGEVHRVRDAIEKPTDKPNPSKKPNDEPQPAQPESECPRNGTHSWTGDGDEMYCLHCFEPYPKVGSPSREQKIRERSEAVDHLIGMTKTIDTLRLRIDDLKARYAKGDMLWKLALDKLDEARTAFAQLARKL